MLKPYYDSGGITIYHGSYLDVYFPLSIKPEFDGIITDPPYNIGYKYLSYSDDIPVREYMEMFKFIFRHKTVFIHYPEDSFKIFNYNNIEPQKCVAWIYNGFTPRKWRLISWLNNFPDFSKLKQPYKNLSDKRIIQQIKKGSEGCNLWDWWHDEQVKNVSSEKTDHPCQIPLEIMKKIISITDMGIILDPFMGSGTTLRAAKDIGRKAIGIETEEKYCEIAAKRLSQEVFNFGDSVAGSAVSTA